MPYIDLSHTITNGLVTYKGLPAPFICDYLSRENSKKNYPEGTSFQIGRIDMVANTGTYIDCPFHRYAEGEDLVSLTVDRFVDLPGILIWVGHTQHGICIDVDAFTGYDLENKAVLVCSGWSKNWNTEHYYENHPYLTEAAAQFLVESKVALVGIDSHNIDDTRQSARPVHSRLLAANILIVEHMTNLHSLVGHHFKFTAIPPKISGIGSFPVRAFATLQDA